MNNYNNLRYDPVKHVIEHDMFKYNTIHNNLNENGLTPYKRKNLLETAKNYYYGSLRECIELDIDYTNIAIRWNNLIKKIEQP